MRIKNILIFSTRCHHFWSFLKQNELKELNFKCRFPKNLFVKNFFSQKKFSPYQTFIPKITLGNSILDIFWKINIHLLMILVFSENKKKMTSHSFVCIAWFFHFRGRGSIFLPPWEHFHGVDICLSWLLNFQGSPQVCGIWNGRKILLASTHLFFLLASHHQKWLYLDFLGQD